MNRDREMDQVRKEIDDLSDRLKSMASDKAEQTNEMLKGVYSSVKDSSKEALDKAKETGKKVEDYTTKNPWKSLGLAAAAGLIIGMLMGKKK